MRKLLAVIFVIFALPVVAQTGSTILYLPQDTTFTTSQEGLFVDMNSFTKLYYEAEQFQLLRQKVPDMQAAYDSLLILQDSSRKVQTMMLRNQEEINALQTQSKNELEHRVIDLQFSYNTCVKDRDKFKRQRNTVLGIGSGILFTSVTMLIIKK